MNKKLVIAIIIILIIIIAIVCIFNLNPKNKENTIVTGETLENINTVEDSKNHTNSNSLLEVSNETENTIKETNTIENESSKQNSNNTDIPKGTVNLSIKLLRLPHFEVELSLKYPAQGSVIASNTMPKKVMTPAQMGSIFK